MKANISRCIKNVTNEYVNEVSYSYKRPAEVDFNPNKSCVDTNTAMDEEVERLQPFLKKARYFEEGNINKFVLKTSDADKKKIDLIIA